MYKVEDTLFASFTVGLKNILELHKGSISQFGKSYSSFAVIFCVEFSDIGTHEQSLYTVFRCNLEHDATSDFTTSKLCDWLNPNVMSNVAFDLSTPLHYEHAYAIH